MTRLEPIYLNILIKYLPKETILKIPLINTKCKTSIERSTESYVISDLNFLQKHFQLLNKITIPSNAMTLLDDNFLSQKLTIHLKEHDIQLEKQFVNDTFCNTNQNFSLSFKNQSFIYNNTFNFVNNDKYWPNGYGYNNERIILYQNLHLNIWKNLMNNNYQIFNQYQYTNFVHGWYGTKNPNETYKDHLKKNDQMIIDNAEKIHTLVLKDGELIYNLDQFVNVKKMIILIDLIKEDDFMFISTAITMLKSLETIIIELNDSNYTPPFNNFHMGQQNNITTSQREKLFIAIAKIHPLVIRLVTKSLKETIEQYNTAILNDKIQWIIKQPSVIDTEIPERMILETSEIFNIELNNKTTSNYIFEYMKKIHTDSLTIRYYPKKPKDYSVNNLQRVSNTFYIDNKDAFKQLMSTLFNQNMKNTSQLQKFDFSEIKEMKTCNIEVDFIVLTQFIFPQLTSCSIENYDFIVSNVFQLPLKHLTIKRASFLKKFEFPLTLESLTLCNFENLNILNLSQHSQLKKICLHHMRQLTFISFPSTTEELELRFIARTKKVELEGIEKTAMHKCIFDHCKRLGTIELSESVSEIEISNCDDFGIENFYDLSLSKETMMKYKKYAK